MITLIKLITVPKNVRLSAANANSKVIMRKQGDRASRFGEKHMITLITFKKIQAFRGNSSLKVIIPFEGDHAFEGGHAPAA